MVDRDVPQLGVSHLREQSAYQDGEAAPGKLPAISLLDTLSPGDEESHGADLSSASIRPSSPSPPTSTDEDEKRSDLESGRASFSRPHAAHDTPAEQIDSNVVSWDGPDDSSNPVNWSRGLKWGNVAVVAAITFIT
jgi:hypothetical protein